HHVLHLRIAAGNSLLTGTLPPEPNGIVWRKVRRPLADRMGKLRQGRKVCNLRSGLSLTSYGVLRGHGFGPRKISRLLLDLQYPYPSPTRGEGTENKCRNALLSDLSGHRVGA